MEYFHQGGNNVLAVNSPYAISGADSQVLTLEMKPNAEVTAEPGSLMFMSPGIKMDTGCCTNPARLLVGETCCKDTFTNSKGQDGYLALTPNFPAKVIPVDLNTVGNKLICKKGVYFSHIGDVQLSAGCDFCPTTCFCGGLGFFRLNITGTGTVFLSAGGVVLTKVLAAGEILVVDTEAIVAFQESVTLGVRPLIGIGYCCAGMGCFNTLLTGPGLVVVESMSFAKFKRAVQPAVNGGDGGVEDNPAATA